MCEHETREEKRRGGYHDTESRRVPGIYVDRGLSLWNRLFESVH